MAEAFPCPICQEADLTAVETCNSVRGFLIAYQTRSRKVAGCPACVSSELRGEALRSLGLGWFSLTSIVINPFFILLNFGRSMGVKPNPDAVSRFLDEVGVPEPGTGYRIPDACVAAASALIKADGQIDAREVEAAAIIGEQIIPGFESQRLIDLLEDRGPALPLDAVATVLRVYLTREGQVLVMRYLLMVALADGQLAKKEDKLLLKLAEKSQFGKDAYLDLRDAELAEFQAAA